MPEVVNKTIRTKCTCCRAGITAEITVEVSVDDTESLGLLERQIAPMQYYALRYCYIRAVLKKVGGNRLKAAKHAGISERTLYRWIEQMGGDPSLDPKE